MIGKKIRAAIVSNSLSGGGAERFVSSLSKMLDSIGVEVHIILVNNQVDFDFKGQLFSLETASNSSNSIIKKITKGFLLKRYLQENQIQLVIDNRPRNLFLRDLIAILIYGKRKKWFVVHSFNLKNYFPESKFLAQLLYKKADKLICVSKEIQNQVIKKYNFSNTVQIYNPVEVLDAGLDNKVTTNYILYFGRFIEKVKNFSLLLEAYRSSEIHSKGYNLYLLGEGPDLDFIQKKISDLKLEKFVTIIPFVTDPSNYILNSKFTVLTSQYEGFPMTIIESLALGIPVISVDCESGPNEIIKSGFNGLLVENYNVIAFSEAMKRMIDDESLYNSCKTNAVESIKHLSLEPISAQWKNLLDQIKQND